MYFREGQLAYINVSIHINVYLVEIHKFMLEEGGSFLVSKYVPYSLIVKELTPPVV